MKTNLKSRGFTLIELLIVLAIGGIAITLVSSAWSSFSPSVVIRFFS